MFARFGISLLALVLVAGCSASFRTKSDGFDYRGLGARAYLSAGSHVIGEFGDRDFISAGIFRGADRKGEIASVDVWPLFGIGVGLAGVRLRVLPLEVGAGALFYRPSPPERKKVEAEDDETLIPSEPEFMDDGDAEDTETEEDSPESP